MWDLKTIRQELLQALNKGDYQKAITIYKDLIRLDPDNNDLLIKLGDIYFRLQKFEKAIAAYKRVIVSDPNDYSTLAYLGDAYFAKRDYTSALEIYEKSLNLNPNDEKTLIQVAKSYEKAGNFFHAAKYYEKAMQTDMTTDHWKNLLRVLEKIHYSHNLLNITDSHLLSQLEGICKEF